MTTLGRLSLAGCLALAACGPVRTRPTSLADAAVAAQTPQSKEAATLAPTSFAEAESLRRAAEAAYDAGDAAGAEIQAERAIAAYARAFADARVVRAGKMGEEAKADLSRAEGDLAKLKEDEGRAATDLAALEARIKVARDALPPPASGPADPAREAARLEAARSLTTEARLLCVSARLLDASAEGLTEADTAVSDTQKLLAPGTRPAPIDAATRARAGCLSVLTKIRRALGKNAATDEADALLADISREGSFAPLRDDRGVVVTVDAPFKGADVATSAVSRLELAGKIAAAHPDLPVLVVVHDATAGKDDARDTQRGESARKVIAKFRDAKLQVVLAGATHPLVDPRQKNAKNERLEIVFVSRLTSAARARASSGPARLASSPRGPRASPRPTARPSASRSTTRRSPTPRAPARLSDRSLPSPAPARAVTRAAARTTP